MLSLHHGGELTRVDEGEVSGFERAEMWGDLEPRESATHHDPEPVANGTGTQREPDGETTARALRLRSRLLDEDQLIKLAPPQPLVDGILTRGSLAVMWGKPASGKSFCALDLACSVASGAWWLDHSVTQGPVLYVAAEGTGGLRSRHDAWRKAHNIYAVPGMRWLPEAVNLLDRSWVDALCMVATELEPVLIVLDTLARSMVGGDENSARDMGIAVASADRLRTTTGATTLATHHDTKEGSTMRGSSVLLGAVDTSIELKGEGKVLTMRCEKQKDAPPFADIRLRLEPVDDSCAVVRYRGGGDVPTFRPTMLMERVSRALEALPEGEGLSGRAIEGAVRGSNEHRRLAVELLVAEGYLALEAKARIHVHRSIRPYREGDDPRLTSDEEEGRDDEIGLF